MNIVVISCGGTGGHLSPGIALAEELIKKGTKCYLVISNKEVDSRLINKYSQMDFIRIPGIGFSGKFSGFVKFIREQFKGLLFSIKFLHKVQPDVVIGFGGFTTVGLSLAARMLGVPIFLHEANRKVGKAIRFLSILATRIYLPCGVHLKSLPPKTLKNIGFPVRKEIRPIAKSLACQKLEITANVKRLLVFGGSQGASVLNKWVFEHFESLAELGIHVYCITGLGKGSIGKLEYTAKNGVCAQAIFTPFVDDMTSVLSSADLVLSRAGAGSIAEICRCHIPAILIPYPFAADNHQEANAAFFERQGGGLVISEKDIDQLYSEVVSLIFNDWLLTKFEQNMKLMDIQSNLSLIANDLEEFCTQEETISLQSA